MVVEKKPYTTAAAFFQDDGYRINGVLFCERERIADASYALVFCHGYGATIDSLAPDIATGLATKGDCAVLIFDYSGFGGSEGPHRRLDPNREVLDIRAAVSWMLASYPEFRGRIGLYGTSFGAAMATAAAADDARIGALVSVSAFASGERWMRELRPHWEWIDFSDKVAADALSRSLSGESAIVDPDFIMPRDPAAKAFNEELKRKSPERRAFRLDLVSAQRISEFDVLSRAPRLMGRASLFVHTHRDLLMPWQNSRDLAAAAGGELYLIPDAGHYDVYAGDLFQNVTSRAIQLYETAFVRRSEEQ